MTVPIRAGFLEGSVNKISGSGGHSRSVTAKGRTRAVLTAVREMNQQTQTLLVQSFKESSERARICLRHWETQTLGKINLAMLCAGAGAAWGRGHPRGLCPLPRAGPGPWDGQ